MQTDKSTSRLIQLRARVVQYRVALLAIAIAGVGLALIRFGPDLRDAWADFAVSVGNSLLSIGLIAIVWDLWMRRSWVDLVRDELTAILIQPDMVQKLSKERNTLLLGALLTEHHGPELGEALFHQSLYMGHDARATKTSFIYNIDLSAGTTSFHCATLYISFNLTSLPAEPRVHFAQIVDSLKLHSQYEHLLDADSDAIYRYILQADSRASPDSDFTIREATVRGVSARRTLTFEVDTLVNPATGSAAHTLRPRKTDRQEFKAVRKGPCHVTLKIDTVVDARRNVFPIWFGYPVKDFQSSISARDIDATKVDVLQFFSSSARYERLDPEVAGSRERLSVSGKLEGLVLPDSGLTYLWR